MNAPLPLRRLEISVSSGDALDVRHFRVSEGMSRLYEIALVVVCHSADVDLDAVVGQSASFTAHGPTGASRTWSGVASQMTLIGADERGLSTYELIVVPRLWLLTQNCDSRIFQQMSEIDIVLKVLGKWGISPSLRLSDAYRKRKYRVQYEESDHDFVCRMLEDAGVSFYFDDGGATMVLSDAPQDNPSRGAIRFLDQPTTWAEEHVTNLHAGRAVKPGKVTLRDHDYRKPPSYKLLAEAAGAGGVEAQIERYHYTPGGFLFERGRGDSTPAADDKGKYRVDEAEAHRLAERRLHAHRAGARSLSFETNAVDIAPGTVISISDHPRADLGNRPYLITGASMEGRHDGEWSHRCQGGGADVPFHPERRTPRPRVCGVESATVVGPPGEEIHTDEFGRVRVHFHWDRDSKMDDRSSCWIHVSQPWGGGGYGGINLPRVGQEVIVDFLGGDPDRPVIVGRVFTALQRVPSKLPESKTQTVFRSQSTHGKAGYNEILYEDQAGAELFKVQAERDYCKLVKNDELTKICNDLVREIGRSSVKKIGQDHSSNIGNDENIQIGSDQNIQIGGDQDEQIGGDQDIQVGGDRSLMVGRDQAVTVTCDESVRVGEDQDITVGGDRTIKVAGNERETIDQNQSITITSNRTSDIGQKDSTAVGQEFHVHVKLPEGNGTGAAIAGGAANHKAAGANKAGAAKGKKERSGPTAATLTDKKIVFTTGDGATITLDGATITLDADVIKLKAKKKIDANAETETVTIHARKDVAVRSDQTMHLATKGGILSVIAKGGDMKLTTDKTFTAFASEDSKLMASKDVKIGAGQTAGMMGYKYAIVTSTQGTGVFSDENIKVSGKAVDVNAGAGAVSLQGHPWVLINPEGP